MLYRRQEEDRMRRDEEDRMRDMMMMRNENMRGGGGGNPQPGVPMMEQVYMILTLSNSEIKIIVKCARLDTCNLF